jgi:hypothetical protein
VRNHGLAVGFIDGDDPVGNRRQQPFAHAVDAEPTAAAQVDRVRGIENPPRSRQARQGTRHQTSLLRMDMDDIDLPLTDQARQAAKSRGAPEQFADGERNDLRAGCSEAGSLSGQQIG